MNDTKKIRRLLLKQMLRNFSFPSTGGLLILFLTGKSEDCMSSCKNKPDLDPMRFDDLYNNFKIVKQEVKGTASSSSQNLAFMSSTSSTNKVITAYGVSTANTQASTASTQVSTANLSDDNVYAFLASQPNGS
ncbi:hypothetical protein Tco_0508228 [Tanacetum coccineum]